MKLEFEYGQGMMAAELPDSTDIFIPGETVADPPALEDPVAATREAILNPIGIQPLSELCGPGKKMVIIFPDKVKGGNQPTSHRKVSIPIVIEEALKAGMKEEDITLLCSNGLHKKMDPGEWRMLLGDEIFNRFYYKGQIENHDSENWDNLVDLGTDEYGDPVIMNKKVYECDVPVLIGHCMGNPYGGYSGGYKHCATGITHWRSIASHHCPQVMHRDDFVPVSNHNMMRDKFDAIGAHQEKCMGHQYFTVDAVLDTKARQIAVFAGSAEEVQKASFPVANKRTYVPWAEKKYNVLVFGMPQQFHYGNGHGTNPILMLQAIAAQVIRHKRILADNCVVICSSLCNGYFHDEVFTGYRELWEKYQTDYNNILPDLAKYGEYFATRQDYIDNYRYCYGFHPFHGLSMISCGHIAQKHLAAMYIVGAQAPGYARSMGMQTRATFEEALEDAKKIVGAEPNILALPRTFTTASVHLMMKDEPVVD